MSINKCNNTSTSGPNKLSQRHLKVIIHNLSYFKNITNIANTCINLGHWPLHFKTSTSIIIPKPNKALYDISKIFKPIIILNIFSKLIKKVIDERLQFQELSKNVIHLYQLDSLEQQSTTDTNIVLTYFIYVDKVKNCSTNTLVFDIVQFFLFLNHLLLLLILDKARFDPNISQFF